MAKMLLAVFCFFCFYWTKAQNVLTTDSVMVDSVRVMDADKTRKIGFWLAAYMEPAYQPNAKGGNLGGGVSLVYAEQIHIGFYGVVFAGDYQRRLIFPNDFSLQYYQFGLWTGYKTAFPRPFQLTTDLRVGEGKVFWERNDNFYDMFEDYALLIQPSLGVDVKLLRFAALHGEVGYRRVAGLNLPEADSDDFSGMSFNLMVKLGLF